MQSCKANMDIQPVISISDVLNYIANYAAESETRSKSYEVTFEEILDSEVSDTDTVEKAAQKLFVKSVVERDYSAQEVFYILMSFSVIHSSREFVSVTVRNDAWVHLQSND